jgi:hypothetical protein
MIRNVIVNCTFPELGDICEIQRFRRYALDISFHVWCINYNALRQYGRHPRTVAKVIGIGSSSFQAGEPTKKDAAFTLYISSEVTFSDSLFFDSRGNDKVSTRSSQ